MHDRTRPVHRKEAADACGRRDPCRWAWPARLYGCGTDWPGAGCLARRPRVSGPGRPARYEILVDGVLDDRWADWFGGLQVKSEGTQTVIFGPLPDQPALHRLLANVRDLGLCPDLCTRCGDGAYSESDRACGQDGLVGKTGANICYALRLADGTWD
jgi:hypothetical protein